MAGSTTDHPSTSSRTPAWRTTFLDHFDNLRSTNQANISLDVAYTNQQCTATTPDPNHDPRLNASRESSPVFITQSRESSPVFRINHSRATTPGGGNSIADASREATPATYSRESTPVLSLDMDDPVQAATAIAWLKDAVPNFDSGIDDDRFRNLVAISLAEEPAVDREVLYSRVAAVDEVLAGALRAVLDTVEWGGGITNSEVSGTVCADGGDKGS